MNNKQIAPMKQTTTKANRSVKHMEYKLSKPRREGYELEANI